MFHGSNEQGKIASTFSLVVNFTVNLHVYSKTEILSFSGEYVR